MTKSLGKPYAGKPHVRFDEGVAKLTNCWLCTLLYFYLFIVSVYTSTVEGNAIVIVMTSKFDV